MKSVVGLVEYTVTGAFVWLVSLVLLGWIAVDSADATTVIYYSDLIAPPVEGELAKEPPEITIVRIWAIWANELSAIPAHMFESSKVAQEVMSVVVGGAFFVAVFVTGALVDLCASTFLVVIEATFARRMFRRSDSWLRKLVMQHGDIVVADYKALVRRRKRLGRPGAWQWRKYRRVTAFLYSYVLANAKPAQVEELLERLKVWRVNQAICLSLLALGIAICGWWLVTGQGQGPGFGKVLVVGGLVALSFWAMHVTFIRLVTSLEATLYLSYMQDRPAAAVQTLPSLTAVPSGIASANAGTRPGATVELAAQRSAA